MPRPAPPNEPGSWTLLDSTETAALWKRVRQDPAPVTQFYVIAPTRQHELYYDENSARQAFANHN